MDKHSNLVPLLLLIGGSVSAFAFAVAIVNAVEPSANQFLWFAITSVAAVIGWNEMRSTDEHNNTFHGE